MPFVAGGAGPPSRVTAREVGRSPRRWQWTFQTEDPRNRPNDAFRRTPLARTSSTGRPPVSMRTKLSTDRPTLEIERENFSPRLSGPFGESSRLRASRRRFPAIGSTIALVCSGLPRRARTPDVAPLRIRLDRRFHPNRCARGMKTTEPRNIGANLHCRHSREGGSL